MGNYIYELDYENMNEKDINICKFLSYIDKEYVLTKCVLKEFGIEDYKRNPVSLEIFVDFLDEIRNIYQNGVMTGLTKLIYNEDLKKFFNKNKKVIMKHIDSYYGSFDEFIEFIGKENFLNDFSYVKNLSIYPIGEAYTYFVFEEFAQYMMELSQNCLFRDEIFINNKKLT